MQNKTYQVSFTSGSLLDIFNSIYQTIFFYLADSIDNEEVSGPMEGLDDPFYTSTRQWGEQQVIYMPTLRDGVVDPSKDTQEKINSQIAVIKENYRQRTNRLQVSVW